MMKNDAVISTVAAPMKKDLVSDTTSRLLIRLVLDISPSMGSNRRIAYLNAAVKLLLRMLRSDPTVANKIYISETTFSTEVNSTPFVPLKAWKDKTYVPVREGGSNMSGAVLEAYAKVEEELTEMDNMGVGQYVPFVVVVTDGDPDKTDDPQRVERAIRTVHEHCSKTAEAYRLVAPFVIGVGEQVDVRLLNRYASDFTGEAILVADDPESGNELFSEIFTFIGKSVKNSIGGSADLRALYQSIKKASCPQVQSINRRSRPIMV